MFVVTIKNEKAVEMVLNSTCESSCFLVTKIFNNFGVLLAAIRDCADILPLVELPERNKVPSSERTTFKLNTNPANAASPKMDFNVNHLTGTETTREVK